MVASILVASILMASIMLATIPRAKKDRKNEIYSVNRWNKCLMASIEMVNIKWQYCSKSDNIIMTCNKRASIIVANILVTSIMVAKIENFSANRTLQKIGWLAVIKYPAQNISSSNKNNSRCCVRNNFFGNFDHFLPFFLSSWKFLADFKVF